MALDIKQYTPKQVPVMATQITSDNMGEVAEWCSGEIRTEAVSETTTQNYIKVPAYRAMNERQTKGYLGDWILKRGETIKVYTDNAFRKGYVDDPSAIPMTQSTSRAVIFDGLLDELRGFRPKTRGTTLTAGSHKVAVVPQGANFSCLDTGSNQITATPAEIPTVSYTDMVSQIAAASSTSESKFFADDPEPETQNMIVVFHPPAES